jgi:hypothetical protein
MTFGDPPPGAVASSGPATAPKADAPPGVWIGEEQVRQVLGDWAAPLGALIPIAGRTYATTAQVCSKPQDAYRPIGLDELAGAVINPIAALQLRDRVIEDATNQIWGSLCEYVPSPDPNAPPPPPLEVHEPPPLSPSTPLPPDPTEPTLSQIFDLLLHVNDKVADLQDNVTWLSQQVATRGFTRGGSIALIGTGQAAIPKSANTAAPGEPSTSIEAMGLEVTLLTEPPYLGRSSAAVATWFKAGFLSYGSGDSQFRTELLSRPVQLFWPWVGQLTRITWELEPGVTATVKPLYPVVYTPKPQTSPVYTVPIAG